MKKIILFGLVLLFVGFVIASPYLNEYIFDNIEDAQEFLEYISQSSAEIEGEFEIYNVVYDLNGENKEYQYKFRVDYHAPNGTTIRFTEYGQRSFSKDDNETVVAIGLQEDMENMFFTEFGNLPLVRYVNESDPFYGYTFNWGFEP